MNRTPDHLHGAALIIVLACLVMITGLVIAFLSSMQSRVVTSRADYASGEARLLADTAINVVIGQIQNATQSAAANNYAWASQPGMVRTYGNDGQLVEAYKLYSAETMVTDRVDPAEELAALENWDAQPALFTDLNAPRNGIYPIVDPTAADGMDSVEGFELATPPGSSANPAPMPGRWLYLLENGTLAAPSPGEDDETAKVPGASANNKIVGRLAFWSDDETSRVNINTAAGDDDATDPGSYWDLPFYDGDFERDLASKQPVNAEFQRYPGHPATVSLSTVFPELTREQIYQISPRIADGGSRGGTQNTSSVNDASAPRSSLDEDRLYASIDELVFEPGRAENAPLTKEDLRRKRFFLTATSRAPEVTLFGTPRISLWPVHSSLATDPESPYTSAYDRLAAFSATYGAGHRFYIQRQNADSAREDYEGIPRNQDLYEYLKTLTSRSVPGFGGTFLAKYPQPSGGVASDRDQILTQMFDYIRSTNLFDTSLGGDYSVGNTSTAGNMEGRHPVYPAEDSNLSIYQFTDPHRGNRYAWPGHGQVAPIVIEDTKGFGRSYGVTEAAIHLICTADGGTTGDPALAPEAAGSAYDHRTVSNLTVNRRLKNAANQEVDRTDAVNGSDLFWANRTLGDTPTGSRTALLPGQKRMQAVLLVKVASPSHGFPVIYPDLLIHASGLDNLTIGDQEPFPAESAGYLRIFGRMTGGTDTGLGSWTHFMNRTQPSASNVSNRYAPRWDPGLSPNPNVNPPTFGSNTQPSNYAADGRPNVKYGDFIYQWVSDPFTVDIPSNGNISFGNTEDIIIKVYAGNGTRPEENFSPPPAATLAELGLTADSVIQTLQLRFPDTTIPAPDLLKWSYSGSGSGTSPSQKVQIYWGFPARFLHFSTSDPNLPWTMDAPVTDQGQGQGPFMRIEPPWSGPWKWRDSDKAWPAADYSNINDFGGDVVRSLIVKDGDTRLVLGRRVINHDDGVMVPHPDYHSSSVRMAHGLSTSSVRSDEGTPLNFADSKLVQSASYYSRSQIPDVPRNATAAQQTGDWDNGLGPARDGAYINMPDEGSFYMTNINGVLTSAYYTQSSDLVPVSSAQFSPNRIIHSSGQFGSLPTGVMANTPWQTLLFRPQPNHPQSRPGLPPDHLIMDLFTMPAVEPYAISEPFSTAGKVNMNYQILPYTYIHRSTALHAALEWERVTAVPTSAGPNYKRELAGNDFRFPLNLDLQQGTLRQFEEKFSAGEIFRSATEICDIYLTPEGEAWTSDSAAATFWNNHRLTGDNARERPYAKLYAKLTTRSNSYKIYYRVQALQKPPNTPADEWIESRDRVTGEQRGSALIERYLDPNDTSLPDYATDNPATSSPSLDSLYQFRILARELFDH